MSEVIELDIINYVVNCDRTDSTELMTVDSCRKCKVFLSEDDGNIFCLQPKKFIKYKTGKFPKKEGDE